MGKKKPYWVILAKQFTNGHKLYSVIGPYPSMSTVLNSLHQGKVENMAKLLNKAYLAGQQSIRDLVDDDN